MKLSTARGWADDIDLTCVVFSSFFTLHLLAVGGPPEIDRVPTIYGDGQIRQLSERDRRNLEQQQDSMFDL